MPQIQVLPLSPRQQQPSFGAQLGQQLGGGVGEGISGQLQSYLENKQTQKLLESIKRMREGKTSTSALAPQQEGEAEGEGIEIGAPNVTAQGQPHKWTPEQIAVISKKNKALGDALAEESKQATQREQEFEKRAFKKSEKYLDKLGEEQRGLIKKDIALKQMRTALESGEFSGIRNALADYTGLEFLKTAPAQAVNSAIKEYLISDLSSITGRPNQFIEKQLSQALVNPQFKEEANQAILLGLEGLNNLKKREIEIANDLEETFLKRGMEIPRNFQNLVDKKLKKEADTFEKGYQEQINSLFGKQGKKAFSPTEFSKGTTRTSKKTGIKQVWTGSEWKEVK